jgi:hypothetical protein
MMSRGFEDGVGVRIYSNMYERDSINLCFSFSVLKEYIKSRYVLIEQATDWAKRKIAETQFEWKKRKVCRALQPIEVLEDIANILESRYEECYYIATAITDLKCETTVGENDAAVTTYRGAIVSTLPELCDAIDAADNDLFSETLTRIIYAKPQAMHSRTHYQLEKIFTYLADCQSEGNIQWGRMRAEDFANEFAKKYVVIKPYEMSFDEIKLLVRTACYLESQAQEKNK